MQLADRTENMAREREIDCDFIAHLKTLQFSSLEVDLTFCQHGFDIEVTLDGANSPFIGKCGGCGICRVACRSIHNK
jgi:hypothetical protein